MNIVFPFVLQMELLTYIAKAGVPADGNLTIRLYGNNLTPGDSNITADFTEISGGGYTSKPLTFANWTISSGSPATYPAQQWTFTGAIAGPGTVYGFYVTRNNDGKFQFGGKFDAPISPVNGSVVNVTPTVNLVSLY